MKEITFNVLERILLIGIFNHKESKVDIETLAAILEDVKSVALSDEEKKEINLQDILGEDGKVSSLKWDKSVDKAVKLSEKTIKFVLEFIKNKSDNKELVVTDAPLLEIKKKLESNE